MIDDQNFSDFKLGEQNKSGNFEDFKLPEIPKTTPNTGSTFLSRASEQAKGMLQFAGGLLSDPSGATLARDTTASTMESMIDPRHSMGINTVRTVGSNLGFNPDAITEDYKSGNKGALVADIGIPIGIGVLMHKAGATKGVVDAVRTPKSEPKLTIPNKYADTTATNWGKDTRVGMSDVLNPPVVEKAGIVKPPVAPTNVQAQIDRGKQILADAQKKAKPPETLLEAQQLGEQSFTDFKLPETTLDKANAADVVLGKSDDLGAVPKEFDDIIPKQSTKTVEELPLSQEIVKKEPNWDAPTLAEFMSDESGVARGAKTKPRVAPNPLVNKLMNAVLEAGPLRAQQEKLYSQERGRRFAEAEAVDTPGMAGHYEALSKLKGELPKIDYEGLKLAPEEVDSLVNIIRGSKKLLSGEKIHAVTGLRKILGHDVPQRGELALLREVFGDQFGDMMELHAGIPLTREMVSSAANTMKALRASVDFSAPLRQGLPLIHKSAFWDSAAKMFPQAFSEEAFRAAQSELYERPLYLAGKKAGLFLSDLGGKLSQHEEAFGSKIAEKIPAIGPLVRGSERAYTGFLNKLRANVFDDLVSKAAEFNQRNLTDGELQDIASFVNNRTGRGSLDFRTESLKRAQGTEYGNLEKIGTELNTVFFSPRLISSRLNILNPMTYVKADPFIRREAVKSLFAIGGAGAITLALAKLAGGDDVSIENNLTSSDAGKAKIGNTRLDPWGGTQQYVVAASRLLSGETESLSGKTYDLNKPGFNSPSRMSIASNFAKSKLSPIAGLAVNLASNKLDTSDPLGQFVSAFIEPHDSYGKPIKLTREITDQFIPMFYSDIRDIAKDNPNLIPISILGMFGMGTQTIQPSGKGNSGYLSLPHLPNVKIR